jgi:septal ring factor EnvC (AmiA/AmiB activator)
MLSRKIEATEQKMTNTEQALEKFAAAVAEYAKHLSSHTSAIQGLSEASHELKKGAAEQNRVLMTLMENMSKPGYRPEARPMKIDLPVTEPKPEVKKPAKPFHGALNNGIPGCARKHPPTPDEVAGGLHR